jgi:chromosome segregation ATPase
LPSLRSLSMLRSLLPYAEKLLPVLTGVAIEQPRLRSDLSVLDRHVGEIQIESRGLRSKVESQGEEIERILQKHQEGLDSISSAIENIRREQQELARAFRSLAGLLKGLFFAILFLLIAGTALSVLILFRLSHV